MRTIFFITLSMILANCSPVSQEISEGSTKEDILEMFQSYRGEIESRNYDNAVSYFSGISDFDWYEDGRLAYDSKEDVLNSLKQLDQYGKSVTKFRDQEVDLFGNQHAVLTTFYQTRIEQDSTTSFSFSGVMTIIVQKEGSKWKIRSGHVSTARQDDW